jgi:plasmid stability protein
LKEIRIAMKQSKISVDEETHKVLKVYCAQHGLLMSQFVAEIIRERIGNEREGLRTVQDEIRTKEST